MSKKKILIVEDETDMVYAVKLLLEANGFEVFTAYDGKDALEKAGECQPDLIILDILLPKLDGYKVCKRLKSNKKLGKVPVIILTALVQDYERKLGFDSGADAYLAKPFEQKMLLQEVRKLLTENKA